MKRIVLCADDYGQVPEISEGIVSLLQHARISATSCLVTSQYWVEHAKWLQPLRNQADIGLHFNLTEGTPLSTPYQNKYGSQFAGLSWLLPRSLLLQLDKSAIAAEFSAQLDQFINIMGSPPDFIDGHQHIHQFRMIREVMLEIYKKRNLGAYVRWVDPSLKSPAFSKKCVIKCMGSGQFGRMLRMLEIAHNGSFSGMYDFKMADKYPQFFRGFLAQIADDGIIMCHPASRKSVDVIGSSRLLEYNYLNSNELIQDLDKAGIEIGRWSVLSNSE